MKSPRTDDTRLAAGQQKKVSPFPTIPTPLAPDIGQIFTCVQALSRCMNLIIVNAQQTTQYPNLTGTDIFAKAADLNSLMTRVSNLENK